MWQKNKKILDIESEWYFICLRATIARKVYENSKEKKVLCCTIIARGEKNDTDVMQTPIARTKKKHNKSVSQKKYVSDALCLVCAVTCFSLVSMLWFS